MADPAELLALAVTVAREAGAVLVAGRETADLDPGTKSTPTDVVTAMDRAAERLIGERLRAARPGDGVLGEEGGEVAGASGVRWVVDPVDGTVNYLYRLPHWAVSIAAEVDGDVVAGVVHAPLLAGRDGVGTTWTAVRGGGAQRDGVPLSVSTCTELAQALVATGFGYAASRRAEQAVVLTRVLPRVRDVRRLGAASVDLCGVASGTVDAYYEQGLQPWDLAAGGLVAAEAGALVTGLRGARAGEGMVVAAPPALHAPLVALLED